MKKSKHHTPGPWLVEKDGTTLSGRWYFKVTRGIYSTQLGTNEADAHLIAAAPEMLAALELCHARGVCRLLGSDQADFVETTIAKARGQK